MSWPQCVAEVPLKPLQEKHTQALVTAVGAFVHCGVVVPTLYALVLPPFWLEESIIALLTHVG